MMQVHEFNQAWYTAIRIDPAHVVFNRVLADDFGDAVDGAGHRHSLSASERAAKQETSAIMAAKNAIPGTS